ncbi:hypothetical protein GZH53_08765 [Flavihumibacter sp. R14]|nr:hypothetical protein [Flavihumibacter soli]
MNKPFSVNEIMSEAWNFAKKNIWILLGFTAVQFVVIIMITTFLSGLLGGESPTAVVLQNVILSLFDAFFTVAFYQVIFKQIDEEGEPQFPDFVPNLMKALNFVLVKLIIGIMLVFLIGIISLIYFRNAPEIEATEAFSPEMWPVLLLIAIPVTYFTIRLCFVVCFIVDQESGASESISQSWTLTKNHFWFIFVLFLIILGLNILGAMALFIGLLFTVPFSSLILIITYRQMVNSYADEEDILIENSEK